MTIVSFRHRFIFIKTRKTAGTSIEVDLSRRIEAEAIVTPVLPPVPGHTPRNFQNRDDAPRFRNHMRASEVRAALGLEIFDGFFKFCVEREPVEKCLSHFHMLKNRDDESGLNADARSALTWDSYVRAGSFPLDAVKYEDPDVPGRLLVDRVLSYERLSEDLGALAADLGIPDFKLQSRAKSDYRRKVHMTVSEVTAEQRAVIYAAFKSTRELTGLYPGPVA
ncbi:hypothetical protein ACWCOP_13565 [Maricaulaceae bacterium MS644]